MTGDLPKNLGDIPPIIRELEERFLQVFHLRMRTPSNIYLPHFLLWGAGNRSISQCRGFANMLNERNFSCAAAILRMQLDTVLRLCGGIIYGNISEYTEKILAGEKISSLKSSQGDRLHDRFLVDELSKQLPWIKNVYDRCSGSIHLSKRHIMLAIDQIDDSGHVSMQIGPSDKNLDDATFLELGQAFAHTSFLVLQMIEEWFDIIEDNKI